MHPENTQLPKNKILSLESLRGFAAISVAFYHFRVNSHFQNEFFLNAWLMVDFFFVLSGFVIALNYQSKISSLSHFQTFQYKRFLRLYPLHLIMLTAFLFLELIKYFIEINYDLVGTTPAFSLNNFSSFALNFLLLQNWFLEDLTYNVPSWSISAEFYTYAIFGCISLAFKNSVFRVIFSSIILILISGLILLNIGMGTDNIAGPIRCIFSFFIGVITFNLYNRYNLREKISSSFFSVLMFVLCIFLVALLGKDKYGIVILMPIFFSITLLVTLATKESTILIRALSHPKFVYLGTISYGIYMIHFFIWWCIRQFLILFLNVEDYLDENGMTYIDFENKYFADFLSLGGIAIIIFMSHLSYKYIEKRFYVKKFSYTQT